MPAPLRLALSVLALAAAASVHAQAPAALQRAAQQAIETNPEVTARYNALQAALNEVDVARGGLLPRLDLSASVGRDSDVIEGRVPDESVSFSRNGVALTLRQLLWDGQATRLDIARLGHARLTRWFDLLDTTEQAALGATQAYVDVLRYRRLVELAEDNYVQHKLTFDQLQSRFKAGVGRGVDLEQANARLALADSNLTTELANLHDVSARYLRIVGEVPPAQMPRPPLLDAGAPAGMAQAQQIALARNGAISAAVESLRAARAQASQAEGALYQPTIEARLRSGAGKNFDGVEDQKRDTTAEVVLNWNLFKGGSDRARVRQYAALLNQAADLRDKACRDVRQTVAIAYNDIGKLQQQLAALERNVLSIQKTRDAYRQQFDIGQRSLLDLLNAENELYTARREQAGAEHDLAIAWARTHAAANTLTAALGVSRRTADTPQDAQNWSAGQDAAERCPVAEVVVPATPRSELDARAARLQQAAPAAVAAPVASPMASPATPAATPPAVAPASSTPQAGMPAAVEQQVSRRLEQWAAAWSAKDADGYLGFYGRGFNPAKVSREQWQAERRARLGKPGAIQVRVEQVQVKSISPDLVETRFVQSYSSADFKDSTDKALTWKREGGDWVIVRESNR